MNFEVSDHSRNNKLVKVAGAGILPTSPGYPRVDVSCAGAKNRREGSVTKDVKETAGHDLVSATCGNGDGNVAQT